MQVTPAVNKTPAASSSRVNSSPQPLTTLNLSSAVSIVPASQARVSTASKAPPGKRSNCFWSLSTSFCVLFTLSDYLLAISFSAGYGISKFEPFDLQYFNQQNLGKVKTFYKYLQNKCFVLIVTLNTIYYIFSRKFSLLQQ